MFYPFVLTISSLCQLENPNTRHPAQTNHVASNHVASLFVFHDCPQFAHMFFVCRSMSLTNAHFLKMFDTLKRFCIRHFVDAAYCWGTRRTFSLFTKASDPCECMVDKDTIVYIVMNMERSINVDSHCQCHCPIIFMYMNLDLDRLGDGEVDVLSGVCGLDGASAL